MKRVAAVLVAVATLGAGVASAQAVPEGSQAARLQPQFRRTPYMGIDPFRYTFWPGWGLMLSGGASGWNNALNASDIGAILFLSDSSGGGRPDGLLVGDYLDIISLIPQGEGLGGLLSGEGGAYLGGPFGSRVSFGVSAMGRGYGNARVPDSAVAFFRDGNTSQTQFDLSATAGNVLGTADVGAHALINLGPLGSIDAVHLTLGFGGRYIRPLFYSRVGMGANSNFSVTQNNVAAQVDVESYITVDPTQLNADGDAEVAVATGGSGTAADFLLRLAWPTSGFAVEAMVANIGSVTIQDVRHETLSFGVSTRSLQEVSDSVDAAEFVTQGTGEVKVTLPRIVRFAANGWANRILQLDAAATMPVSGDFETPLMVELGSTWRFSNTFPIRVGLLLGGLQGIGYTGSVGLEARNVLFRLSGASLGGLFKSATGAYGRLEMGFFF